MGKTISAVICFILAGAIFFLYTQSAYSQIGATQAQIKQYQDALDKAAQLQALKQQLLSRYNAFNPADVTRLQTMLPDSVDNIGLILDLDNLASRHGMALENVDVSTPQSAAPQQSTAGIVGATAQKYDSLTLHFTTYGTYDNFRSFLTDLEHSLRLVDLVSLTVAKQGTAGTAASAYSYDLTVKTYWLK